MNIAKRGVLNVVAVCAAIGLGGCGGGAEKKTATQVAAKVNKTEISVHQINTALAGVGNLAPEQAKLAGRDVLERLVDQELLIEKAINKKLDRDPRVMQAMESSKRQILAQAYMDQLIASVSKPTAEEVKAYFAKHPELFSERRLYRFQEISAAAGRDQQPELQKSLASAKSLNDVVAIFKTKNIKYSGNVSTKSAEQLPLELLPKFSQMKNGQLIAIPGDNNILLLQLLESRAVPVDLAVATPAIEQYLTNQRRSEVAAKEVKQLRADAKIEYVGDFAKDKAVLEAEIKTAADSKAKTQAEAIAKAKAAAEAKASAAAEADAKAKADFKARVEAQAQAEKEAKGAADKPAAGVSVAKDAISKGLSGLR